MLLLLVVGASAVGVAATANCTFHIACHVVLICIALNFSKFLDAVMLPRHIGSILL